jgi:hypothetical protein
MNAPPEIVRKINARRKSDGKKKIHRPRQEGDHPRPLSPFFRSLLCPLFTIQKPMTGSHRFVQELRESADGRAIQAAGNTSEGRATVNVTREAARRWRAMSDSEKSVCEI